MFSMKCVFGCLAFARVTRSAMGALLATAAASACSASPPEQVGQVTESIRNGTPDTTHEGVVVVEQRSGNMCTGYLITPNLVLTARHCVADLVVSESSNASCDDEALPLLPIADIAVGWGQTIDPTNPNWLNQAVAPQKLIPLPKELACNNDVVLIQLPDPLPFKTIELRVDLPALEGESFTAVGYGFDGPKPRSEGTRRELGDLRVTFVGASKDHGSVVTRDGDWIADRGPCGGDSGGPALDGAGRSFGVMVRGKPTVCESMKYNGIAQLATFLREQTRRSVNELRAQQYDVVMPSWVTPPAKGSAKSGEDCWSATQCEDPLSCLPVGERLRCTIATCETCPEGTTCEERDGLRTCTAVEVAPPTVLTADAGSSEQPAAKTSTTVKSGCSVASGQHEGNVGGLAMVVFGVGVVACRRRSRRGPGTRWPSRRLRLIVLSATAHAVTHPLLFPREHVETRNLRG